MWQSQAFGGAFSFGGAVPKEFATCWARAGRAPSADAAAATAAIEALRMNVRREFMSRPSSIEVGERLHGRASLGRSHAQVYPGARGLGLHSPASHARSRRCNARSS